MAMLVVCVLFLIEIFTLYSIQSLASPSQPCNSHSHLVTTKLSFLILILIVYSSDSPILITVLGNFFTRKAWFTLRFSHGKQGLSYSIAVYQLFQCFQIYIYCCSNNQIAYCSMYSTCTCSIILY